MIKLKVVLNGTVLTSFRFPNYSTAITSFQGYEQGPEAVVIEVWACDDNGRDIELLEEL